MKTPKALTVIILTCALAALTQSAWAQSTHTPWTNLTPDKMTAVWWEWGYSIPYATSPWLDESGANAANSQPYFTAPGGPGQLLFLVGTDSVSGKVGRRILIKEGTALFFPIINIEWDNMFVSPRLGGSVPVAGGSLGVPGLRALTDSFMESVSQNPYYCTLAANGGDPEPVASVRLSSPPFAYHLPAGNIYEYLNPGVVVSGTVAPAVSDGYWVFLPGGALKAGSYVLHFGGTGTWQGYPFFQDITYQITVMP